MFEYVFTAVLGIALVLLYCLANRPGLVLALFRKRLSRDAVIDRKRPYIEAFGEHKKGRTSIVAQALPWFGVIALFLILSNQFVVLALITTWSMEPTLHRGDLVLLQTVDRSAKVGDIVTYGKYKISDPITHRVVEITKKGDLITKGDANPSNDEPAVSPKSVMGKIVLIGNNPIAIPGAGYLIKPERVGEFSIVSKLPKNYVFAQAFDQLRTVSPLVLFFCSIFYLLILIESKAEGDRRFGRNGRNGKNGKNTILKGTKPR